VFKLPYTKTIVGGKEGYNVSIAKYFIGEEIKHYVPHFGCLIVKVDGPLKVMKLVALTKVVTLK
jgi:hypothetical protein